MKRLFYSFLILILTIGSAVKSQTTAMNFIQNDCSGFSHNLFSELDSGNVIIMEFIMTCSSCIAAGHAIETMMTDLEIQYPGKVRLYQIAYTNSYTCSTMDGFKNTNAFSSTVFDQGANMVAYYGGFGMPTVAIAAGTNHDVLYTNVGFGPGDTTQAGTAIRSFLSNVNVNDPSADAPTVSVFPNPANDIISIAFNSPVCANADIQVVDLSGKIVRNLFSEFISVGNFQKEFNINSFSPGFYMIKTNVGKKITYCPFNILR